MRESALKLQLECSVIRGCGIVYDKCVCHVGVRWRKEILGRLQQPSPDGPDIRYRHGLLTAERLFNTDIPFQSIRKLQIRIKCSKFMKTSGWNGRWSDLHGSEREGS